MWSSKGGTNQINISMSQLFPRAVASRTNQRDRQRPTACHERLTSIPCRTYPRMGPGLGVLPRAIPLMEICEIKL